MVKQSAGILPYRLRPQGIEFCIVHPGGPFYARKDEGAWSIAKGEIEDNEDKLAAAKREFREEMGFDIEGQFTKLDPVKLKSGKQIHAWAVATDFAIDAVVSNTFSIEWPPRSGKTKEFPEIDKAGWFTAAEAILLLNPGLHPLISQVLHKQS